MIMYVYVHDVRGPGQGDDRGQGRGEQLAGGLAVGGGPRARR